MRLTNETWKQMTILEAVTTIEALQQENERLKDDLNAFSHIEQCRAFAGLATTVGDLQQENEQLRNDNINAEMNLSHMTDMYEQLQAQVERYREALKLAESRFKVIEQATEYVKPGTGVWHTVGIALQEIRKAIAAIDKIGGREDA